MTQRPLRYRGQARRPTRHLIDAELAGTSERFPVERIEAVRNSRFGDPTDEIDEPGTSDE